MDNRRTRRRFSDSFKIDFVQTLVAKKATMRELMDKYGLSRSSVDRWIRQYREGQLIAGDEGTDEPIDGELVTEPLTALVVRPNGSPVEDSLRDEIIKLRADNEALRRERDLFRTAWIGMRG